MVGNITLLMIFAVFDPSPLTLWINCSFSINTYYMSSVVKVSKDGEAVGLTLIEGSLSSYM